MLTSETTRTEIVGNGTLDNSGSGYSVGFKVLADTDLKVYVDGTLRTLTSPSEYTVANAGTNTNATVSFLGSAFGTPATQLSSSKSIVFVRDAAFTQPSNYQNNDIFDAETLENSLDRATMLAQQSKGGIDRAIKFSDTATGIDTDVTTITAAATLRANKLISFDANGDIQVTQEIGTFKGDWATSTVYVQRDLVKQNSDSDASTKDNIYICTKAHTSTGQYLTENDLTNTVTDKWTLVLDVASASGGLVEAVAWSTKTDGQVVGSTTTDYSSKAYAIGGTGIDSGAGSAKDWASKPSGNVGNTNLKSARQYVDDIVSSASTASNQATTATNAKDDAVKLATNAHNSQYTLTDSTTGYSALHYATEASNSATTSTSNASRFLTAASSDPTTRDPNGTGAALQEGDLYFNTTDNKMKVRNASNQWQDTSSSISSVASVEEFTASNGQGTANKYFALVHDVGLEIVWLNGVRLKRGDDYICTNTNSDTTARTAGNSANFVRLETVPGSSDILSIMAFGQIDNNLAVNKAGGAFTGGVTFEAGTTHNTGSNTFTLPTTRGTDNYVLTRDDSVGTGGTAWKEVATSPAITSVTTPASDNSINEDDNVTMTINGANFTNTMTVSLVDATNTGNTVTNHGNLGIASFVSSTQITVNTVAATYNISNSSVKVKLDKSGLTATSASISVSPDPAFSAPSSNGTTLATILDITADDVEVIGSSGIVASASDSASITYALDQTSTNANNTWQFNTTTGVVKTPTAGVYDVPSGSSYTEPFTVTATAGGDNTRTDSRTFNIIVNKAPIGGSGANGSNDPYTFTGDGTTGTNGVTYRVHQFWYLASGHADAGHSGTYHDITFQTYSDLSDVEYLVIAGGGSGAVYANGPGYTNGNSGNDSLIIRNSDSTTLVSSTAGGYGGRYSNQSGGSGGSGGGGGGTSGTGGSAVTGGVPNVAQGYNGATATGSGSTYNSGGGGGAGEAGSTDGLYQGGDGLPSYITGSSVTRAGGGGANDAATGVNGAGGDGGGGRGTYNGNGLQGTDGTGSGGGAGDAGIGAGHGGGGAGGYKSAVYVSSTGETSGGGTSANSKLSLPTGTYTMRIGAGGARVGISTGSHPAFSGRGGHGIIIIRYAI